MTEALTSASAGLRRRIFGAVSLAVVLSACGNPAKAPPTPPTPEVSVVTLQPHPVAATIDLPGRVEAVRTAEVHARVDGIVQRRLYDEGTDVKEGAPLFLIDPREKRAAYNSAAASLQRAQATLVKARQDLARYTPLVARKAISAQEFDGAQAAVRQGEADVASAQAAVDQAKLSLDYTTVRSPLTGRVGRAEVTEGALVSASQATLMTRVDQLSPVYVRFSMPNADVLALRAAAASGEVSMPEVNRVQVRLKLEDGSAYPSVGYLNFFDLSVDPSTGGMTMRAQFPNDARVLLPGQFVRGKLQGGVTKNGLTVPQRAVQFNNTAASVMLVAPDGVVSVQPIEVGDMLGGDFVVRSGLKPGDRVITDGLQKAQPGQKVKITAAAPGPAAPAPSSAPASAPVGG